MSKVEVRRVVEEAQDPLGRLLQAAGKGGVSGDALLTLARLTAASRNFPNGFTDGLPYGISGRHLAELQKLFLIRQEPGDTTITLI